MKKSFIALSACALMASGVAVAETVSSAVTVKFTGEVVETPCVITVGNAGTVDLGHVKKAKAQKGTVTPIPFRLSECGSYNSVSFHWNTPTIAALENGKLATNIAGVYVAFYSDAEGKTAVTEIANTTVEFDDGHAVAGENQDEVVLHTPFYAQLVTDDNTDPTAAGSVTANMAFKVDFEYK